MMQNIPAGVQLERSFGEEIMDTVTRPILGQKAGTLRGGKTPWERVWGPTAPRGKTAQRG
jgi:hypothetical protein